MLEITIHREDDEPLYSRETAARLANVSLEFLQHCEDEGLVRARRDTTGARGYTSRDIRQLARIRRLHRQLELDLAAVEVILHMRRQVVEMQQQMRAMEREMRRREQEWLHQVQELRRRAARESEWS